MAAEIESATSGGPYVPRVVADEIVDKLRVTDPDLLAGWLDSQAAQFVWQSINNRDRSVRSRTRHQAKRQAFAVAAGKAEAGDFTELRKFMDMPIPVADGTTRKLGILRKDDLAFAADRYGRLAHDNQMMEAFLRALAKKVGAGTVEERYSEEQLQKMFGSFGMAA
jgi:hypothetical protein